MTEFFQTKMGQQFYDGTMRRIADELSDLNKTLARIVALLEAQQVARENTPSMGREASKRRIVSDDGVYEVKEGEDQ